MKYRNLGKTELRVSVAGLGCGGSSCLGLSQGKTEAEAIALVQTALDLGVTYIDTARSYGTEGVVGQALRGHPRDSIVIATKCAVPDDRNASMSGSVMKSIEESLRALQTDYIDVLQLHGPRLDTLDWQVDRALPELVRAKAAGKIRHIGVSERNADYGHDMLGRAAEMEEFEVVLVAFHMMHQSARLGLIQRLKDRRIGIALMSAVRGIYSRPHVLRQICADLCGAALVPAELGASESPLGFLLHEQGAQSLTEAAYRFARHESGADVVLVGTGDPAHLRANIGAILMPSLPDDDLRMLRALFEPLAGVGLERHA